MITNVFRATHAADGDAEQTRLGPDVTFAAPGSRRAAVNVPSGFLAAAESGGVPEALEPYLITLYRDYQGIEEPQRQEWLAAIKVLREKNEQGEVRLKQLRAFQHEDSPRIRDLRKETKDLEAEAANPQAADAADYDELTFWASALLLVALTGYLVVFYTSAGYSAFFKNIGAGITVGSQTERVNALFQSIFDAGALPDAVRTGNLFVVLFPVIFLSLGFVIHKLYEHRKHVGAAVFLLVAFTFDCLIAYQIAEKLFEAQLLTGLKTGEWGLRRAAADVNFWSVISAGFVVYIVWTFVLGFLMKESTRRAASRRAVHDRRRRIDDRQREIRQLETDRENEISQLEDDIRTNNVEIQRLQTHADGRVVLWQVVEQRIETFLIGWQQFLVRTSTSQAELAARIGKVREIANAFKTSVHRSFSAGSGLVTLKDVSSR